MGTALVTGASAGLGLEFAWQLATARHDVVLVARDEGRLTRLAAQLEAAAGIRAEVLAADLTDRADVERVAARLRDDERPVGLLVNNAGMGLNQPFVDGDVAAEERALDLMVRAPMVLSHAAAGAMKRRGRGAILNVGSVAGLTASGTYSAHKAWVRVFTEALAVELKGTGVTATVVAPGFTHTEFHERGRIDTAHYPSVAWLDAEDVVAGALADVRRGVVLSTPSLRYKAVSTILKLVPRSAVRTFSGYRRALADDAPDVPTVDA
ncbi:SDR family NAD(P)-dependent oxidoreductase [Cellulomonas xiejunii]|uniref:SDR family oxidoreductase n=1 Tax=Cellulomonas xiejunii TaxID=2968083 RepID=A0ABY5KLD0_9CELL|nr:SDR family oxidoreductase [Cellulomonas xiejunii]MCC2315785.1 SDR family oxidoreductase [Cellulomonas xiejunii]MCC2320868.1 SDR family oxidoreductase [Cellulomonas xiejunii]UUI71150.1 SDR family oxidoreductase [Cellulomonas xiejunii]